MKLLILAIVGALIGWMTNVIAIKLLFRPVKPVHIMGNFLVIQGMIPKRKTEIAKTIGDVVAEELLSIEQIVDDFVEDLDKRRVVSIIKDKVVALADAKMPAMVPSMFKGMILQNIEKIIDENGDQLVVEMAEKLSHEAVKSIDISQMVESKINGYDFKEIERLTLRIAKRELKHIELLGGLIGFAIGLIQGFFVLHLF
ncbi:DUF445 domain-containing protein [Fusibacter tunisiensis]|jgi:uncharacterized membrane protein YheB (UPF0754 family)|uniref:Uncharacterized membrane protein YheB (UPF0754 family) n=1 Tax=Fusibacter tunisiensis TaxID=1008308 RepID=A0ABS2MSF1_9FIRM|nr:DUF445 family protein [Fusibacter tunisiensis]MBM7562295.1 uncharacterized membrane protein YheB (UPF0754 family) [Fusibacter tunisiensis]